MKENIDENLYDKWYKELVDLANELLPYYDIDKIKDWSVFVWTKDTDKGEGENVFDINDDDIIYYECFEECNKNHQIIEEAKPIIEEIQKHFKNRYYIR